MFRALSLRSCIARNVIVKKWISRRLMSSQPAENVVPVASNDDLAASFEPLVSENNVRDSFAMNTVENEKYNMNVSNYNRALASGKFEFRILIPASAVGILSGKGGQTFNLLREKINGFIDKSVTYAPENIVTIICRQEDIERSISEYLRRMPKDKGGDNVEIRLLVHHSLVQKIATKLEELQQNAQAQIVLFKMRCPKSTEQVVLLKANKQRIVQAVDTIAEFLHKYPITDFVSIYDVSTYDSSLVDGYGGFTNELEYRGYSDCYKCGGSNHGPDECLEMKYCYYCGSANHGLLSCRERSEDMKQIH